MSETCGQCKHRVPIWTCFTKPGVAKCICSRDKKGCCVFARGDNWESILIDTYFAIEDDDWGALEEIKERMEALGASHE